MKLSILQVPLEIQEIKSELDYGSLYKTSVNLNEWNGKYKYSKVPLKQYENVIVIKDNPKYKDIMKILHTYNEQVDNDQLPEKDKAILQALMQRIQKVLNVLVNKFMDRQQQLNVLSYVHSWCYKTIDNYQFFSHLQPKCELQEIDDLDSINEYIRLNPIRDKLIVQPSMQSTATDTVQGQNLYNQINKQKSSQRYCNRNKSHNQQNENDKYEYKYKDIDQHRLQQQLNKYDRKQIYNIHQNKSVSCKNHNNLQQFQSMMSTTIYDSQMQQSSINQNMQQSIMKQQTNYPQNGVIETNHEQKYKSVQLQALDDVSNFNVPYINEKYNQLYQQHYDVSKYPYNKLDYKDYIPVDDLDYRVFRRRMKRTQDDLRDQKMNQLFIQRHRQYRKHKQKIIEENIHHQAMRNAIMHQNIENNNKQKEIEVSCQLNLRKKQIEYQKEESNDKKKLTEIRKSTIKLLKLKPINKNNQEKDNIDKDDDNFEDEREDPRSRTYSIFQRYNHSSNPQNFEKMRYINNAYDKFNNKQKVDCVRECDDIKQKLKQNKLEIDKESLFKSIDYFQQDMDANTKNHIRQMSVDINALIKNPFANDKKKKKKKKKK